jgi:hypothetical protein
VLTQSVRRGDLSQKSQSLIHTAELFLPLQVIMGVKLISETRNWAPMLSAVVKKIEKQGHYSSQHMAWNRLHSLFSSFFCNHRSILIPVSCFQTNSPCIITCSCPKHLAEQIRDSNFQGAPPLPNLNMARQGLHLGGNI